MVDLGCRGAPLSVLLPISTPLTPSFLVASCLRSRHRPNVDMDDGSLLTRTRRPLALWHLPQLRKTSHLSPSPSAPSLVAWPRPRIHLDACSTPDFRPLQRPLRTSHGARYSAAWSCNVRRHARHSLPDAHSSRRTLPLMPTPLNSHPF